MADSAHQITQRFSDALYRRDWDAVAACFGPDSVYWDINPGPTLAARGPESIVKRVRLAADPLVGFASEHIRTAVTGDVVLTEHNELWQWASGETMTLPIVSVQVVSGQTIAIWKDYWDYQMLVNAAPAAWWDSMAGADLSWVYDASGVN